MKTNINEYAFRRAFESTRPDNFSYQGQGVLFEYFESLEDDTGIEIEFDMIAICCGYSEETPKDIAANYWDIDISECTDDEAIKDTVLEYLREHSEVCGTTPDGDIVYRQF